MASSNLYIRGCPFVKADLPGGAAPCLLPLFPNAAWPLRKFSLIYLKGLGDRVGSSGLAKWPAQRGNSGLPEGYGKLLVRGCLTIGFSLLILLLLLLSNLEAVAFDLSHYREQFRLLERPAATGMTEEELLRVTGEILAYLKGQRQDLELVAEIAGQDLPLFSRREQEHMVDVRNLFARGFQVRKGDSFFWLSLSSWTCW